MRISSMLLGLVLGVSLTATVPALAERLGPWVLVDRDRTLDELDRLAVDAEELARRSQSHDALQRVESKRRARELAARLRRLSERLHAAPEAERVGRDGHHRVPPCAAPGCAPSRVVRSMSDAEFRELSQVFEHAAFSTGRLAVLHQAARGNYFSVAQVGEVMDWFMIDREKVDAAALLWPRVVDPERAYMLYEKLSFDSSQRELDERLRQAAQPRAEPAVGARPYMSMR